MGGLNKKTSTILMLIAIIICLSLGGYGFFASGDKISFEKDVVNPNKDFLYQGKLYFYNGEELLGTYTCENPSGYCGYAHEYLDDADYSLDYYNDEKIDSINLISNRYAFITDTENPQEYNYDAGVILYDIVSNRQIARYNYVKNYSIGIENGYYIVQNAEGLWGVIQLTDATSLKIPFEYQFIGLQNQVTDELVDADIFVVAKDDTFALMDINGAKLTSDFNEQIFAYNGKYVITKNSDRYYLSDYAGNTAFNGISYKRLWFTSKYLNIVNVNNEYYLYDIESGFIATDLYLLEAGDVASSKISADNKLEMYINDKLINTIE